MLCAVPNLVVEIHVPMTPSPDVAGDEDPFFWIDDVEDRLAELEEDEELEVFDDGEEVDEEYVFFVTGAPRDRLLRAASDIALGVGMPTGVYAVLSTDDADEIGVGERVDLPVR